MSERDLTFGDLGNGLSVDALFKTPEMLPSRPAGRGDPIDLGVEAGRASWSFWRFAPGAEVSMHHTDTIDFNVIVAGQVELLLEDGEHLLGVGDCVVMTGVDHAWRAGAQGCVASAVALGTPTRR